MSSDTPVASDIRHLVAGYLEGHLTRRDLDRQLARFTRAMYASDDAETTRLYGATRRLLTERGDGYRTEDELRAELRRLIAEQPKPVSRPAPISDAAA